MGDFAFRTFARAKAAFGLAAITSIAIAAGLAGAGQADAAPADRPTDPVVLKGSDVAGLLKVKPEKIVGFKWAGKWKQIPVQVDERHVVSARSLYPASAPSYVNSAVTFDVEVYADPKTRSGADEDAAFDADDELAFMGGDAGAKAPGSAAAPAGVAAASAARVVVTDPVGGGSAYVYLFKATGKADPAAGRDYVEYDFKLTRFGAEDTLIDDYGFSNSNNPEDSTVTTDSYRLHSTDRWNEDEIRITAGGAPGTDILDREAASAGGLGGCGRSEYTFSGNWDRGSDNDEGTIVMVKDGPVRAIRSYMGANSGPYVEDDHIYYADREDRTIHVRVHPIPYMYVWTDYNDSAVGMTYRDQKNTGGVAIDGNPDTLVPATMDDFSDGRYLWQQVSGAQGSVTTMVTAVTGGLTAADNEMFDFGGYYLDDSTPSDVSADKEKQCGGDLKAYGASGFGIDGVYPNTDPILATPTTPERQLAVNRVRYFGGPDQTAAEAETLRARAQKPLSGSAKSVRMKAGQKPRPRTGGLAITLVNRRVKARPGKSLTVKLKLKNTGTAKVNWARVCLVSGKFRGRTCRKARSIGAGKARIVKYRVKVQRNLRGRNLRFGYRFNAKAGEFGFGGMAKRIFVIKRAR